MYKLAELENDDHLSLKDFVTDTYQNQDTDKRNELSGCYEYVFREAYENILKIHRDMRFFEVYGVKCEYRMILMDV